MKLKKYLCLAGLLLSVSLSAVAHNRVFSPYGFYLGMAGGVFHNSVNLDTAVDRLYYIINMQVRTLEQIQRQAIDADACSDKLVGEIFFGYFVRWKRFSADLEFLANFADRKDALSVKFTREDFSPPSVFNDNASVRLNSFQANLDFKPGFRITPSADLYTLVGFGFNRIRGRFEGNIVVNPQGNTATESTVATVNRSHLGALRLGLGLQEKINDAWLVRLQYVFTHYKKVHIFSEAQLLTPFNVDQTINNKLRLQNWQLTLGIAYRIPISSGAYPHRHAYPYF